MTKQTISTGTTADDGTGSSLRAGAAIITNNFTDMYAYRDLDLFGDGSDGDVTISGYTGLSRDMYYNNLTVNAQLDCSGVRIFVKGTLTLSGSSSLYTNMSQAGSASAQTGGTIGQFLSSVSIGNGQQGTAGVTGTSAAGVQATNPTISINNGGQGGAGGAGGIGTNAGGIQRATTAPTAWKLRRRLTDPYRGVTLVNSGTSGSSGSSGGGDGTGLGGGSGAGGSGGTTIAIYAKNVVISGTGPLIRAFGQKGGNGGIGSGGTNRGGGGGGAGGGGGWIIFVYETLTGSVTGFFDVTGGAGGNGGAGTGTGVGGDGGGAGQSGRVTLYNVGTSTLTEYALDNPVVSGTAASGNTAGVGATATLTKYNLP